MHLLYILAGCRGPLGPWHLPPDHIFVTWSLGHLSGPPSGSSGPRELHPLSLTAPAVLYPTPHTPPCCAHFPCTREQTAWLRVSLVPAPHPPSTLWDAVAAGERVRNLRRQGPGPQGAGARGAALMGTPGWMVDPMSGTPSLGSRQQCSWSP